MGAGKMGEHLLRVELSDLQAMEEVKLSVGQRQVWTDRVTIEDQEVWTAQESQ